MNSAAGSSTPRKLLYLTFKDGQLIETNNQFAVGNAKAHAARTGRHPELTIPMRVVFGGLVLAGVVWRVDRSGGCR